MRLLPTALAVVVGLLFTASTGASGGDDATNNEVKKFQGKWKPIKIEGRNPGTKEGVLITVMGDKLALEGKTEKPLEFTFKVDAAAKPKAIDISFGLGTLLGIYEFDGDTLRVCYSELQESENGKRPTELSADSNSKRYLWVLKREK